MGRLGLRGEIDWKMGVQLTRRVGPRGEIDWKGDVQLTPTGARGEIDRNRGVQ